MSLPPNSHRSHRSHRSNRSKVDDSKNALGVPEAGEAANMTDL